MKARLILVCLAAAYALSWTLSCDQSVEKRLSALPLSSGTFDQIIRRGQDMTDPQFDAYLQARVIGKKVRWCGEIRSNTKNDYSYDNSYRITVDLRHYGFLEATGQCLQLLADKAEQFVTGEGETHTAAKDGLLDTCNQEVIFRLPLEKARSLPKEGGRICFEGVIGGVTRVSSTYYTVDMGYLVQVVPE